jgi:hypothetical protein
MLTAYNYSVVKLIIRYNSFGCDVNKTSPGIIYAFPTWGVKVMKPETSALPIP